MAPGDGVDERRHHLLAVADGDDIDGVTEEEARIAGSVVAAYDDERARHDLLDAPGQTYGPVALGGEVALQADDVGVPPRTVGQTLLLAVDAHVDDQALMAVALEAGRHANRAEGLDEGQHLQTEDAADGRLEERDSHGLRRRIAASARQCERERRFGANQQFEGSAQKAFGWCRADR